jgi:transposase
MGRPRIQVTEKYLSTEKLHARYRGARHATEKTHWQVLWLISEGKTAEEVAEVTGYTTNWVRELVSRYNAGGPESVLDKRRGKSGRPALLSEEEGKELKQALSGAAPNGGLWSGPEVARWMTRKLGKTVRPQRGWDYLRKAGQTPQMPRPGHGDGDPEAQEAFQAGTPRARSPGVSSAS